MTNTILMTKIGLTLLKTQLSELRAKRPQVVDRLSVARSMGDLAENSDYISAKEELSFLDGQISELEAIILNSQVSEPKSNATVQFGHQVTVKVATNQAVFHIVGEWEADPMKKKVSHSSPLGQALMGKKVGDKVEVDAPAGKVAYTIVNIE